MRSVSCFCLSGHTYEILGREHLFMEEKAHKSSEPICCGGREACEEKGNLGAQRDFNLLYGYFLGTNLENLGGIIWGGGKDLFDIQ